MLRYPNRPPRRPRAKAEAKVATRRSPKWWPVRLNATQDVFMTLIAALTLVKFVSVAIANPAPVAVPGDMVQLSMAHPIMSYETIPARELASPWAKPGAACTLDVALMAKEGGTFSVQAVRKDGLMLSWAGGPTDNAGAACSSASGGVLIPTADYSGLQVRPMPKR